MGLDVIRRMHIAGSCFAKVLMNLSLPSENKFNNFWLFFTISVQDYEGKAVREDGRVAQEKHKNGGYASLAIEAMLNQVLVGHSP